MKVGQNQYGLTQARNDHMITKYHVLEYLLRKKKEATISEIALGLKVNKGTIHRIIKKLESRGNVKKRKAEGSGKAGRPKVYYSLSENAMALLEMNEKGERSFLDGNPYFAKYLDIAEAKGKIIWPFV